MTTAWWRWPLVLWLHCTGPLDSSWFRIWWFPLRDRSICSWPRCSVTSFGKAFNGRDCALNFYISFGTAVLTARTSYLYCIFFAFTPAVKRDTSVAFQGITWKKETNTKIELIAWIWKAVTPNYPIVTIQYFCFSTRKPFGIKWILNLWPSPHFFRQAFLGEKRAKCSTNL